MGLLIIIIIIIIIIITIITIIQHGVWQCRSVCSLSRFVKADASFLGDKAVVLGDTVMTPCK